MKNICFYISTVIIKNISAFFISIKLKNSHFYVTSCNEHLKVGIIIENQIFGFIIKRINTYVCIMYI